MDQETYNSIIDWLKEQGGFQVDKLVRTRSWYCRIYTVWLFVFLSFIIISESAIFAQGKDIFLYLNFLIEMSSGKKGVFFIGLLALAASAIFEFSGVYKPKLTVDPPKTVDYVDLKRYVGRWY